MLALPLTQHPYVYGLNNPVLYTDPKGESVELLIGGVLGAGLLGGTYVASQLIHGCSINWNTLELLLVTGAIAGMLTAWGGPFALMAANALFAGWGYLLSLAVIGAVFRAQDFGVAVFVGVLYGMFMPGLGSTLPGVMALGTLMNILQYGLTEAVEEDGVWDATWDGLAWSALTGAAAGAIGGKFTPLESPQLLPCRTSIWIDKAIANRTWQEAMVKSIWSGVPRSFVASTISNTPSYKLLVEFAMSVIAVFSPAK